MLGLCEAILSELGAVESCLVGLQARPNPYRGTSLMRKRQPP